MKICFITNASTERCGVREYGEQMIAAIRRAGHVVDVWDGTYSSVVRFGYLPPTPALQEYDLLHLNWDPQAINHYIPEHFETIVTPPLSLFLHDVPPNSTCPVVASARWKFAFEPMPGAMVVPEAIPPTPRYLDDRRTGWEVRIGVTGIRADPGMDIVQQVCRENGWIRDEPLWWRGGPWLSADEEIRRLAKNHVNVCWYQTSGRGKSMAAAFCCAARRPLVLSGSTMFSALRGYEDELYFGGPYSAEELTRLIEDARTETIVRSPRVPHRVCDELSWDRVIQPILSAWKERL